jgi:hypothetical protein
MNVTSTRGRTPSHWIFSMLLGGNAMDGSPARRLPSVGKAQQHAHCLEKIEASGMFS